MISVQVLSPSLLVVRDTSPSSSARQPEWSILLQQRNATRQVQADMARLRVLASGAGSVGLFIVESLARTGPEHIAVMDFDRVEFVNLDRLHAATRLDARLRRPTIDVARRILRQASTAARPQHELFELSVCEPAGLEHLSAPQSKSQPGREAILHLSAGDRSVDARRSGLC